jgi:hypothetical protein
MRTISIVIVAQELQACSWYITREIRVSSFIIGVMTQSNKRRNTNLIALDLKTIHVMYGDLDEIYSLVKFAEQDRVPQDLHFAPQRADRCLLEHELIRRLVPHLGSQEGIHSYVIPRRLRPVAIILRNLGGFAEARFSTTTTTIPSQMFLSLV